MSTLWLVLRLLDVLLYGGIVTGLVMHWHKLQHPELPRLAWGLVVTFAALTYGVCELVFRHQPGGPRLVPLTVGLLILFSAFYEMPARRMLARARARRT